MVSGSWRIPLVSFHCVRAGFLHCTALLVARLGVVCSILRLNFCSCVESCVHQVGLAVQLGMGAAGHPSWPVPRQIMSSSVA